MSTSFDPFGDSDSTSEEEDTGIGQNPFEMAPSNKTEVFKEEEDTSNIMNMMEKEQTVANESLPYVKKYNIIDLYWCINSKLFDKKPLEKNECPLLIIGYNGDFLNLRFGLYDSTDKSFTETGIHKHECKLIGQINVFSETAQLVHQSIIQKKDTTVTNFERIFSNGTDWTPTKGNFEISTVNKNVVLNILDENKQHRFFTFGNSSIHNLISALTFMYNGNAWVSAMLSK